MPPLIIPKKKKKPARPRKPPLPENPAPIKRPGPEAYFGVHWKGHLPAPLEIYD